MFRFNPPKVDLDCSVQFETITCQCLPIAVGGKYLLDHPTPRYVSPHCYIEESGC